MIKASRNRYGVWFDLGQGSSANVEVHYFGVRLRISDDNYAAEMSPADAVSLLRAMLREIAGPSIDDVRDVWGVDDPANCVCAFDRARWRWSVWLYDADGLPTTYSGNTERDALQAAYDAGVAQRGGTTP